MARSVAGGLQLPHQPSDCTFPKHSFGKTATSLASQPTSAKHMGWLARLDGNRNVPSWLSSGCCFTLLRGNCNDTAKDENSKGDYIFIRSVQTLYMNSMHEPVGDSERRLRMFGTFQ